MKLSNKVKNLYWSISVYLYVPSPFIPFHYIETLTPSSVQLYNYALTLSTVQMSTSNKKFSTKITEEEVGMTKL